MPAGTGKSGPAAGGRDAHYVGVKIFGIAAGLLVLMGAAAGFSMRMTRTVDAQLVVLDRYYFPAYVRLAQANIHSVQESAYIRRLLLALDEGTPPNSTKIEDLRQRTRTSAEASDKELAEAREHLNELIPDPIDFDDTVALARLDTRIEFLQEERRRYEAILAQLLEVATAGQRSDENRNSRRARQLARRFRPPHRSGPYRDAPPRRRGDPRHPFLSGACRGDQSMHCWLWRGCSASLSPRR